jgi:cyclopropane-fatty-acyl-phospholipid synthase
VPDPDDRNRFRSSGSSAAAIRQHYDVSDDFFRLWLGEDLVYSCALWDGDSEPAPGSSTVALEAAQRRKLDDFADRLDVRGARVLDVGCGWGALLDRWVGVHGAAGGVGLTLSRAQREHAAARGTPGVEVREESWVDHVPERPYDVVTCIESTEHFASDALSPQEKVDVYRSFFETAWSWLRPGGRLGLQLICLDNVAYEDTRRGAGTLTDLILDEIFPEAMSPSLSELAIGWETWFRLDDLAEHTAHYVRTFRAWTLALRAQRDRAAQLLPPEQLRVFERYFAAGELCFRLREQSLFRVTLTRRPEPKVWSTPPAVPVPLSAVEPSARVRTASPAAVQSHYDVSDDFYALWLGPTMMYSSALWEDDDDLSLDDAQLAKIDYHAGLVLPGPGARVLDVGCGWGAVLHRLTAAHDVGEAVGLTLSRAQRDFVQRHDWAGVQVRLESWVDHRPEAPYDAVVSFGAFEHFAPDGSSSAERVVAYRAFFQSVAGWLVPGGRLALETIAHDQAPDTGTPLGRGPLGDHVLQIFPESLCPQLSEVLLGLEPWFELEVLRSDAADFARTCRGWALALRAHREAATDLVGPETVRRFQQYLVSSQAQFRTGLITNYRVVLRRRDRPLR